MVPTFAVADDLTHRRLRRVPLLDLTCDWRSVPSGAQEFAGPTAEAVVAVAAETETNAIP